ncbi:adomet-dependent trna methyltransferase complex subunit [Paraphaeosphaeria minitans]|uniref:Adomet-dependent trna methyltransferase complex subunit n=1 Tax=Paraphaeosphaeria minitans TaxID=565426 RepID=A0A9P6G8B3_9PLEO|nr:adomet-dependent trna methyltransferase complex subunit [Paraphaeosphaeria minitans]
MKLLTLNFLTCAVKTCKSSPAAFPLHPRDATLQVVETELNLAFLKNMLPRLMWDELRVVADEVCGFLLSFPPPCFPCFPFPPTRSDLVVGGEAGAAATAEGEEEVEEVPSQTAQDLHRVLLETTVHEGKLVCGNCGHEYKVMEGVPNFLLPGHLV